MFGNIGKMMKLAGELRTKLPQLQAKLAATTYTAAAGEGAVSATVTGKLALVDVKIDAALLADGRTDAATLEGLVKAAVTAAQVKAAKAGEDAVRELTGGLDIPPGLLGG